MKLFQRRRMIRFSDCDPAGIVFFPQYFVMLNGLVEDWIEEELGIGYSRLIVGRGVGLPTVHLESDFSAVSRIGDHVVLSLGVERLGSRSISLQVSCDGTGEAAGQRRVSIRQVLVTTSQQTHQSIDIPPDLRAAIERFRESP